MKLVGIDPGTDSPGFAYRLPIRDGIGVYAMAYSRSDWLVDIAVVECSWPHGPAGKAAMWGLGFRAACQLLSVPLSSGGVRYRITPDAWRTALGLPANLPKRVCVARLRLRYGHATLNETDDVVEARGIAEGASIILARPLKKNRKGLTEVKV